MKSGTSNFKKMSSGPFPVLFHLRLEIGALQKDRLSVHRANWPTGFYQMILMGSYCYILFFNRHVMSSILNLFCPRSSEIVSFFSLKLVNHRSSSSVHTSLFTMTMAMNSLGRILNIRLPSLKESLST